MSLNHLMLDIHCYYCYFFFSQFSLLSYSRFAVFVPQNKPFKVIEADFLLVWRPHCSSSMYSLTKALKEVMVLRIGFNPTRSTSPCYNTKTCNMQWYTNTYTKMNPRMLKQAQWDETQCKELLCLFRICDTCTWHVTNWIIIIIVIMCVHCTVHTILHITDLIIFILTLQTIIFAPTIYIWGKGEWPWLVLKWFKADHRWQGRWTPGGGIMGSVTSERLTTSAEDNWFDADVSHWLQ